MTDETTNIPDRILLYCQSLRYQDSRRLVPDEQRRLGALRVELAQRERKGRWQMPLMVLFVIGMVLIFRLVGIIVAVLVWNAWLPKYQAAKAFTRYFGTQEIEPIAERFVAEEREAIGGLFLQEKPRKKPKNAFEAKEIEVVARSFLWRVNGNPVAPSLVLVRGIAEPPPEVEINIDRMTTENPPESIRRSLTALEAEELRMHSSSIRSQSVLLRWLVIGGILGAALFAIGVAGTAAEDKAEGMMVMGILGGIVFLIFAFFGWSLDNGIFRDYLRLKRDMQEPNVVLIRHPRPEYAGRLVEVLERSRALWTVDGQPAKWRTQA